MPSIYPMALLTLALSLGLWGAVLYILAGRTKRYFWLLLPALPLSAAVNLLVKRPLAMWVSQWAGLSPALSPESPLWFLLFLALLSPVTEEAIKALPLIWPRWRAWLREPSSALWTGFALGLGFGLGEAAYVAWSVAQVPAYAGYPWYAFTGYLGERLQVCFVHGALTAILAAGLQRGGWGIAWGYGGAVLLHLLTNAGAILYQLRLIPAWGASLHLVAVLLLLALILEGLRSRAKRLSPAAQPPEIVYYQRGEDT
jgi:hypothetical protein